MKAKEKTSRTAKSRVQETKKLFPEMKESDMTAIDRKIHALLIAEGYRVTNTERIDGMKINHFTDINRIEYRRGERERVVVSTHRPGQSKETA